MPLSLITLNFIFCKQLYEASDIYNSYLFVLASCKKDKTYTKFSARKLDFVKYSEVQNLRFIDTNFITFWLTQASFRTHH